MDETTKMKNRLISLDSADAEIKVPIIDSYRELKVTFVYDDIITRKIVDNKPEFTIKKLSELAEDDVILTIKRPQDINNNILTLSFIENGSYGKNINESDIKFIDEYLQFAFDTIVSEYGIKKLSYVPVIENPTYTIAPAFDELDFDNKIKVFEKYINSYLPTVNKYLSAYFSGTVRGTIRQIYGKEFEKEILGKFKVPVWSYVSRDEFSSIKIKIVEKMQQVVVNALKLPGDANINKYLDYYKIDSVDNVYFRIPFFTDRNILKNSAHWVCIGPGLFRLNIIKSISELVNLIEEGDQI